MKKISAFLLAAALIFTIVLGASIPAIQKNSAQLAAKMLSAEEAAAVSVSASGRAGYTRAQNLSISLAAGGCLLGTAAASVLLGAAVLAASQPAKRRARGNCRVVDFAEVRRRAALKARAAHGPAVS